MRKTEEDQGAKVLRYGKAILLGSLAAFGLGLVFLLAASVGVSKGVIDPDLRYQLTVAACVLGAFCGGVFAVRACPAGALLAGLAVGGGLFLLTMTAGILIYGEVSFENGGLGLLCGALCGGGAAGLLGRGGRRPTRKGRGRARKSR